MGRIITHAANRLFRARHRLLSAILALTAIALLARGIAAMDYRWRWGRIPRYFLREEGGEWIAGPLLNGLLVTFQLSLIAAVAAMVFGALAAAARLSPLPSLRLGASAYAQFMRCSPLLVQIYLLYFMLGNILGLRPFAAGALSLALFEAAFVAEIIRAGYVAVPQGQADAARALGLSRVAALRRVIIPQALPLVLPPLANLFVSLVKHSSIVTIIAVADLTDAARNVVSETFLAFEVWIAVGALYVGVCFPMAWGIRRWEDSLRKKR